ncbi:MAG: hypothetical protein PHI41_11290, partial [Erysipelotrichaceae bacterium]|nr:hypothetical protein [Erysipelotrichaceae bacterium]
SNHESKEAGPACRMVIPESENIADPIIPPTRRCTLSKSPSLLSLLPIITPLPKAILARGRSGVQETGKPFGAD